MYHEYGHWILFIDITYAITIDVDIRKEKDKTYDVQNIRNKYTTYDYE